MVEISKIRVYGIEESLEASGLPMKTDVDEHYDIYAEEWDTEEEREKAFKRGMKLGTVPTGSGHDNYLKGIIVQFNLKYPQYFTPQLQRYNWIDIVSSQSKMHRLTSMDISKSCNEYVDRRTIENLEYWIDAFNRFDEIYVMQKERGISTDLKVINGKKHRCIRVDRGLEEENQFSKYDLYMKCISNCPMGLEITMRITTNYLQLKTIYQQRKTHKLIEDWGNFNEFILELPYFEELCLKA